MLRRYVSAFLGSAAVHAGLIALIVWLLTPGKLQPIAQKKPGNAVRVFAVTPEDAAFPGLNQVDRSGAARLALADGQRTVAVGGFTFDAGKIAERALVLFPFVSPGVALEHFGVAPADGVMVYQRPRRARPDARAAQASRPLLLSDAALQKVVDKTWARRERWAAFEPV